MLQPTSLPSKWIVSRGPSCYCSNEKSNADWCSCAMAPLVGKLFKLFRLKLLFIIMESIFLIGSVVAAQAGQSNTLIVARTIAGIGGSGIITGGQTIVAAVVPISKRSSFNGFILATFALGQAMGPLIGGALTEEGSWRWCFYLYVYFYTLSLITVSDHKANVCQQRPTLCSRHRIIRIRCEAPSRLLMQGETNVAREDSQT